VHRTFACLGAADALDRYIYSEIAALSRVADVASVEAAVVSIDDMSSTRVNAVYRFECVSGSDLVDGVAFAVIRIVRECRLVALKPSPRAHFVPVGPRRLDSASAALLNTRHRPAPPCRRPVRRD
jgi:hypothetical protein